MSNPSTEPASVFGMIHDGYKADDGNGHAGFGDTPEDANDALHRAQENDFEYSEKAGITGWYSDKEKS